MAIHSLDTLWSLVVRNLEHLLRLVILASLTFYLSFYHSIKVLLESSLLVSIPLLLLKWRSLPAILKEYLPVLILLLIYPLGFLLAYEQHQTSLDWRYYNQAWRAIVPVFLLFIALKPAKVTEPSTELKITWVAPAVATGLGITFVSAVMEWLSQTDGRVSLGTNLILVFAATVSCAAIFLMAKITLRPVPLWVTVTSMLAAVMAFAVITLSNSRGPLLALVLSCVFFFLFFPVGRHYRHIVLVSLIAIVIAIFLHTPSQQRISEGVMQAQAYFSEETIQADSISLRLEMIKASVHEIWLDPLKVRGTQPLNDLLSQEVKHNLLLPQAGEFEHTHNDFLQSWLARGPIGFIGFILVLCSPLLLSWKDRTSRLVGLIVVFNAAILSMTNANFSSAFFLKFYLLITFTLAMTSEKVWRPESETSL